MPKYPKIGLTQPSDGLDTLSKGSFDVKTLNYFLCVCVECLCPVSLNYHNVQILVKQVKVDPQKNLGTRIMPHLIWNVELKTWNYFLCVSSFSNCPNAQIPLNRYNLTLVCPCLWFWGIWAQFAKIALMTQIP